MIRTRLTITLASAAMLGLALTGCSQSAPSDVSDKAVSAEKPQQTTTPSPEPSKANLNPKFGETVTYDGLEVNVSAGAPFTPSEYAAGGTQPNNVAYTVTVKNTSTKNYDPTLFSVTASSAGSEATSVFDSEAGFEGAPQTSVTPGQTITFKQGFNLANPDDVTMDVSPGFEYQAATYTN
jgi:hypothetical protein